VSIVQSYTSYLGIVRGGSKLGASRKTSKLSEMKETHAGGIIILSGQCIIHFCSNNDGGCTDKQIHGTRNNYTNLVHFEYSLPFETFTSFFAVMCSDVPKHLHHHGNTEVLKVKDNVKKLREVLEDCD
jgi:TPP-dependent 2-oxoacid decarboxylase